MKKDLDELFDVFLYGKSEFLNYYINEYFCLINEKISNTEFLQKIYQKIEEINDLSSNNIEIMNNLNEEIKFSHKIIEFAFNKFHHMFKILPTKKNEKLFLTKNGELFIQSENLYSQLLKFNKTEFVIEVDNEKIFPVGSDTDFELFFEKNILHLIEEQIKTTTDTIEKDEVSQKKESLDENYLKKNNEFTNFSEDQSFYDENILKKILPCSKCQKEKENNYYALPLKFEKIAGLISRIDSYYGAFYQPNLCNTCALSLIEQTYLEIMNCSGLSDKYSFIKDSLNYPDVFSHVENQFKSIDDEYHQALDQLNKSFTKYFKSSQIDKIKEKKYENKKDWNKFRSIIHDGYYKLPPQLKNNIDHYYSDDYCV